MKDQFANEVGLMKPDELERFVQFVLQACKTEQDEDGTHRTMLAAKITSEWNDALVKSQIHSFSEEGAPEHIHIVPSSSAEGLLKVSLSEAGVPRNYVVFSIEDNLSIGPLSDLVGRQEEMERMRWLTNELGHYYFLFHRHNYISSIQPVLEQIPADKVITIWIGNTAHEQIFLRLMLYILRDVQAEVRVINAVDSSHMLESQDNKGKRSAEGEEDERVVAFGQMDSKKVVSLILHGIPYLLSDKEKKEYVEEWLQFSRREEKLRIWRQGEFQFLPIDAYDERIMSVINEIYNSIDTIDDDYKKGDYIKAGYFAGMLMDHYPELTSDMFFEYRIRELIGKRRLDFIGAPTALYRFYIKPTK
ncbi:DUF1835 domain-containing protein [Paenibacillus gallinarum]|uniref:DUF1835 domain-containing protein n=1 Tax=Paenibacillus gallinarum TaxID=2762232 RepID=A0ABR8SZ11_9BACL|nr:DUF1835 domain-containing protein [Paenibacillus gallinarum]MBD7968324.1 DUF1835 domain-containing protein [Paenibacillus gallinarum]